MGTVSQLHIKNDVYVDESLRVSQDEITSYQKDLNGVFHREHHVNELRKISNLEDSDWKSIQQKKNVNAQLIKEPIETQQFHNMFLESLPEEEIGNFYGNAFMNLCIEKQGRLEEAFLNCVNKKAEYSKLNNVGLAIGE